MNRDQVKDERIAGMCSRCGYLGFCEARLNKRRWQILICEYCLEREAEANRMPEGKPPGRVAAVHEIKPRQMKRKAGA